MPPLILYTHDTHTGTQPAYFTTRSTRKLDEHAPSEEAPASRHLDCEERENHTWHHGARWHDRQRRPFRNARTRTYETRSEDVLAGGGERAQASGGPGACARRSRADRCWLSLHDTGALSNVAGCEIEAYAHREECESMQDCDDAGSSTCGALHDAREEIHTVREIPGQQTTGASGRASHGGYTIVYGSRRIICSVVMGCACARRDGRMTGGRKGKTLCIGSDREVESMLANRDCSGSHAASGTRRILERYGKCDVEQRGGEYAVERASIRENILTRRSSVKTSDQWTRASWGADKVIFFDDMEVVDTDVEMWQVQVAARGSVGTAVPSCRAVPPRILARSRPPEGLGELRKHLRKPAAVFNSSSDHTRSRVQALQV
ncbi:hypothetical protein EVG20_g9468 [Dentipellis fragilis]|uniref:Uncharacterized protein n=1 Tax=Dentipellis fragilis TaxID=205917 RepID=A0A4Y9XZC5_9AGAM|nr:hypothetical protein EVG20_g9468 [Dentipellis fragilis]